MATSMTRGSEGFLTDSQYYDSWGVTSPSSFYTFDPIRLSPESLIGPINESMSGSHERLLGLVGGFNVLPELKEGEPSPIDCATSLFISTLDWQDSGDEPRALDGGHSSERLGRFPSNDGNAL